MAIFFGHGGNGAAAYLDTYTGSITANTTSSIWDAWTTQTASTTSPWYVWNNQTSATTSTIWNTWTENSNRIILRNQAPVYVPPVLTPEQIASERRMKEERERRFAAERAARKLADERAQELLMAHLTPEQRECIKKNKFIIVEGGKSKSKYRIWTQKGVHGNVEKMDALGHVIENWCVQLKDSLIPNGDHILAQKLMLELDEDHITKVANKTPMRRAA